MNKLYKFLIIVAVALTACNPMEDINKQIDQQAPAPSEKFDYTLTDADYATIKSLALADAASKADSSVAKAIATKSALPEGYAAQYIPTVLGNNYIALGKESVAKVSYNFDNGSKTYLNDLGSATHYTLSKDDYNSMGDSVANHQCFSPDYPASDFIPDFLATKYSSASNGDMRYISYQYSPTEPKLGANLYMTTFDNTLGGFTAYDVTGAQSWQASSYGAKMSGYSSGAQENEDWLVSPQIDLTDANGPTFQINQAINYLNDQWDQIKVLISTDFSGDVTTATWTEVTINNRPTGDNWNFVKSEKVDLSDYVGKKINIAFKYVSTTSNAATWELNLFTVDNASTSNAYKVNTMYQLNGGKWAPMKGVYALSDADYVPMGGNVGKYGDFSSSEPADNYLPQFLAQKYPYAQEGDSIAVMYNYYSSGLKTYVDEYDFHNGEWALYNPIEVKTDQFIENGTKWVFDPTVKFTMTADDYQLIVDAVKADANKKSLVDKYGTAEYYYGASAYYSEFNIQIALRSDQSDYNGLSDSEATDLIMKRVAEGVGVMLQAKFPNAVAQVSGVNVFYVVTFTTYDSGGVTAQETVTYQCTKSAPNPVFTYVSGPDPVQ